ncbi:SpoIIE family protein phosphatase [Pseudofrankia sp. BMG5.36]|uniref:ATP-binding SpoIIE family protein phosphatase n=1 Tax=Pseudofrankia sp. BMG5.36 TaxID=1834512 RepID=UPI000A670D17|nr:SpoIIE family protein phosphatase [Pseudofrankia sp. BMG5.36]
MTSSSAAEPSGRQPAGQGGGYVSPWPEHGFVAPEDADPRSGAAPWPPATPSGGQEWSDRHWNGGQDWSTSAVWPPAAAARPEQGHIAGLAQPPNRPAGSPYPDAGGGARAGYEGAPSNGAHGGDTASNGGPSNGAYAPNAYDPYQNGAYRTGAYGEGQYDHGSYDAGSYAAGGYGGAGQGGYGAPAAGGNAGGYESANYARGPEPGYEHPQEARGHDRGPDAGYAAGFDVAAPAGQGQPAASGGYGDVSAARQAFGQDSYGPAARHPTSAPPAAPAEPSARSAVPEAARPASPGLATTPPPPPSYPPGELPPFAGQAASAPPGAAPFPPPPPPAPPSALAVASAGMPGGGASQMGQPGQSGPSSGGPGQGGAQTGPPAVPPAGGPVGGALPTSAAVAETLFSQAPIALAFHDASGRYVRVNDVLARLNGRPVADHIGRTAPELLGEIGHELATLLGRALRSGEAVGDLEMSVATGGAGPTQTWQASWYPVAGPGGMPLGAVFVAIDVSGRREAEQEATRERERLRLLAEAVASDVLRAGPDGAFDGDMPRWRAVTGQRRAQSDGLGWLDAVHPGDRDTVRRAWQSAVERGESFEAEFRVLGADGAERVMTARALAAAGGGEWVGALTDITELRAAQAASESASGRVRVTTDRVEQIQRITAALARAVTSDDVVAVIMDAGRALGASGRGVALIDDGREQLTFRALQGYSAEYAARWSRISLGAVHPAAEVVRGRRPLFLSSREELTARWPVPDLVAAVGASDDRAWALLPLASGDAPTGVLMFGFPSARDFSLDERGYLELLADQCALAFERAALFEGALAQAAAGRVAQEHTASARADADRAARRLEVLAAVTTAMNAAAVADPAAQAAPAAAVTPDRALRALAEAAVGEIADLCAVYLLADPATAGDGRDAAVGEQGAVPGGVPGGLPGAVPGDGGKNGTSSALPAGSVDPAGAPAAPALLRVAAAAAPGIEGPPSPRPVRWPAASTVAQAFAAGGPRLSTLRDAGRSVPGAAAGEEPARRALSASSADEVRWARRAGAHTVAAAPILRRGRPVGVVLLAAVGERPPLAEQDLALLGELAGRAAEAVDRAELAAAAAPRALAASRRSAPRRALTPAGIAVAARYQAGEGNTSWDWYDVVDLGAGRAGLVIGNIAASGEVAAAAMEALRASVRACARLDLPPHEVITLLDGVLADLADEYQPSGRAGLARSAVPAGGAVAAAGAEAAGGAVEDGVPGQLATCIYAVVEADSGRVTLASAGHPPPLVVAPDGLVSRLYMEVGPPLGSRRDDVKEYVVRLGPDWLLALFTDGLVAAGGRELDAGVSQLAGALARPGAPLPELADDALAVLGPVGGPAEPGQRPGASPAGEALAADAALLLARLPAPPPPGATVEIAVDGGAADVAPARAAARAALSDWSLPAEALETAVLVLSELVGNAVAHGRQPIDARVRRLADRVVVEVADGGGRLPRRRHAGADQEAGRGLELVATLADRWGVRPTADGKVVWAEIGPAALASAP